MRQRAALIGGRIRIASKPEAGTRIVLSAPFARPAELPMAERR
jgi:signal transduction histidine kinase